MKKTYIKPANEVYSMSTTSGILVGSDFDNTVGGDTGKEGGEDYGREDNTPSRPNIWEQSW